MKRLSEETRLLIQQLYPEKKSWVQGLFSSAPDHTSIIEKIASSYEPAAIIQIASLVFSSEEKVQIQLAEAIARILKGLPPQEYVSLDQQMRSSYYYYSLRLEPKEITRFSHLSQHSWVPLAMASMSGNGYVREKSCTLLAETKTPEALPFLLLRTNDWVDQVRAAAIEAILPYLSTNFADKFIDNLYLISRLELSRSRDDGRIKKQIYNVLRAESNKENILAALSHSDVFVKRTCYEMALSLSHCDTLEVLSRGFSDPDVLVRLSCSKKLHELPKDGVTLALVKVAVKDHYTPVKQEALSLLSRFDFLESKQPLYERLCDRNARVRNICRNLIQSLEKDVSRDYFQQYYLEHLQRDNSVYTEGAIAGLGGIGNDSHCQVIERFLKHRCARVRKAAIRAVFKLNANGFTETFYDHLMTDSGSVAKEAALALSLSKSRISSEKLLSLFSQAENTNTKLIVLRLMNSSLGKWDKIITLLKVCVESNETILERCTVYLNVWVSNFNKGNTSASADNLTSARKALTNARERLEPKLCKTLDFYFKEI